MSYQEEIEAIAKRIKQHRKQRSLTIQELAYRCNIERSNLSRIEAGRSNCTVKTLVVICEALGIRLIDLFLPEPVPAPSDRTPVPATVPATAEPQQ